MSYKLALRGSGLFLNPDYQSQGDYSGMDTAIGITYSGTNRGIWQATNEVGIPYVHGDVVIWNGLQYAIGGEDGFDGTAPGISSAYILLPKNASNVGYILEADNIEYDFANNYLTRRVDKRMNVAEDNYAFQTGAITDFQWGNDNVTNNSQTELGKLRCINNSGVIQGNKVTTSGHLDCLTNAGNVSQNFAHNGCNITCYLTTGRSLGNCEFSGGATDISAMAVDYNAKIFSPHLSTFDGQVLGFDGHATGGLLSFPDYLGIIAVEVTGSQDVIDFSTTPTFKRKFTVLSSSIDNLRFVQSGGRFLLPIPSPNTIITANDTDFIEFLWNPIVSKFIQTASNQY